MEKTPQLVGYEMTPSGVAGGVGIYECVPKSRPPFNSALKICRDRPNDLFMRAYFLKMTAELEPPEIESLLHQAGKERDLPLLSLLYEASIVYSKFEQFLESFETYDRDELAEQSPLIYIPWHLRNDKKANLYWLRNFARNKNRLDIMPPPDQAEEPLPFDPEKLNEWGKNIVPISSLRSSGANTGSYLRDVPDKAEIKGLTKSLELGGILEGWETRPEATLSPYAVERPWKLDVTVETGRNIFRLTGSQISYGRGHKIGQAKISCLMEAVERYSSFAGFDQERAVNYCGNLDILKARYADLLKADMSVLNPADLCLETPFRDQEIYWVMGERVGQDGIGSVYVPAQIVFLFPNLDEPGLTSGLPSNGLAAGVTRDSARLAAILEVLERDAEKIISYSEKRSFLLESEDRIINDVLERCEDKGIFIQFLDITTEFGIPCYKAFIRGPNGMILKGTGASLDGRSAIFSALTEIPYPYPYWFGSMPYPKGIKKLCFEELPNYSSGSPERDLRLIEDLLTRNGYNPIYVDLTREELEIPVTRAIVPGLEMMTVVDRFTPLNPRFFGHYLADFDAL